MSLLDESNMSQHSPDSASSESLLPNPCAEVVSSGAPAINAAYVTEQVYKILFINAEDSPSKWEFLKTKAPFPVSKLVENKAITELLLAIEPGPKVDYDGLSKNLALLKPYVLNTPSGPALLGFFKSLLQLRVRWLLAAAKLEAFRCYERTTFTYYVEWNEVFRMDTTGRDLDERELAYQNECQEYTQNQLSASFMRQEGQLAKVVKAEEAKLINFKTSQEMWKNSRIL